MSDKIKVYKGKCEIEGRTWQVFARKYWKKESYFRDDDENVLILKDEILDFVSRKMESYSANLLQNINDEKPTKIETIPTNYVFPSCPLHYHLYT